MSSAFYTKMGATATRLLTKFGGKVAITRNGSAVASPVCVFTTRVKENAPGSMSTTEDKRTATITGNFTAVPAVGDHLLTEREDLTIMKVEQVRPEPNGLVLAYRLELE